MPIQLRIFTGAAAMNTAAKYRQTYRPAPPAPAWLRRFWLLF